MARLHHRYAELEALIQPNTTTLSREDTEQLERAAFLSEVCSFAEAVAIFDGFGESTRLQQPAIAIEYALLLLRQARYAAAHQHLEQALRRAEADGKLVADRPEYRILLILLARAEVWAVGSFRRAKESMDEIRVWLRGVAVEDCTNLHVIFHPSFPLFLLYFLCLFFSTSFLLFLSTSSPCSSLFIFIYFAFLRGGSQLVIHRSGASWSTRCWENAQVTSRPCTTPNSTAIFWSVRRPRVAH